MRAFIRSVRNLIRKKLQNGKARSAIRFPGTKTGYEYSDHNVDWTGCQKQTTYVEREGTYVVRRVGVGADQMAVKQACSVGIRPMYSVYQDH